MDQPSPASRPPPGRRADYRLFRSFQTRWHDNDVYGHMNNAVHYTLFDSAVNAFLVEAGLLDIGHGERIGLVVESGCRYHAEIAFPDPVAAGLRVGRIGRSAVTYEIGLFAGESDVAAAEGFFVHVTVDRRTRRPAALPEAFRLELERIVQ
ncbi:acyl-CoA thioesterase [Antarcticirhabdus aurantiaca]|uniref:Thioesterase family protein n=1 Tax=Antarcticirhabdus aurantiaca TaxID=2606717 RepID=A0ACD4NTD9_9HYPH|nr:thioesterase family protein [Antarcticirhabdus aurantiaca]WAJ29960.1 thioesterase family protein [Jeongeuplla avenae]